MSSIKWLKVILFFLAIVQSWQQQTDLDCTNKDNCATSDASVAKITCEHKFVGTDEDCECKDGTACADLTLTGTTYKELSDTQCSDWCTLKKDSCAFWNYVWEGNIKSCYLMTSDECKSEEPDRQCPSDHSNGEPECRSDKEKDGTCTDGTEKPSGITCPGPITPVDDPKEFVQKWKCYNPNVDKVDMYAVDSMPLNGFCILNAVDGGSCKTMSPEFRFNCETVDGTTGIWKEAADFGADEIADAKDGDKLKDVTCTAPDLPFTDLATQPGRDIVCTQGGITGNGSQYSIPAENYCHMLCDDYDVLSFYTDWNIAVTRAADEKRGWFYKVSSSSEDPVSFNDADFLNCWGKHF